MFRPLHTLALILCAVTVTAVAAPLTFDFKDPKGVNTIRFNLDAPLETISGTASDITGTLTIDPAKPETAKGKIVVQTASLHVPNPVMKDHMLGQGWLDAAKHPTISFEIDSIRKLEKNDKGGTAEVVGRFTLKGITRELVAPVRVTYLPGRLSDRSPSLKGDLLVVRCDFKIKRSDFGIKAGEAEDKVANEIEISMSIAGAAVRE